MVLMFLGVKRLKVNIDVLEAELILLPRQGSTGWTMGIEGCMEMAFWYHEVPWCRRNIIKESECPNELCQAH